MVSVRNKNTDTKKGKESENEEREQQQELFEGGGGSAFGEQHPEHEQFSRHRIDKEMPCIVIRLNLLSEAHTIRISRWKCTEKTGRSQTLPSRAITRGSSALSRIPAG